MLMEDTKHCADRISIRGLLTVREREKAGCPSALIPPASLYTGGKEETKSSPQEVQYLHLLDHISAPSMRSGVSVREVNQHGSRSAGLGQDSPGRPHSTSLKHSWGCQRGGTETEASVWSMGRAPLPGLGPPAAASPGWVWQGLSHSPSATSCGALSGTLVGSAGTGH